MNKRFFILSLLLFFSFQFNFAQEKDKEEEQKEAITAEKKSDTDFLDDTDSYDPLRPARAAFYSAVVPGLGQAYNKRYWKIPIVYGALASSLYYYSINNRSYKRYRTAFKQRQAGQTDEFINTFSTESLESAQKILRQNRDTSLLTFVGLYVLQILEESVSAHLLQFNVNDKISFDPKLMNEPISNESYLGLSLNIKF